MYLCKNFFVAKTQHLKILENGILHGFSCHGIGSVFSQWWAMLLYQMAPVFSKEYAFLSFIAGLLWDSFRCLFSYPLSQRIACILPLCPRRLSHRAQLIRNSVPSSTMSRQSHISYARFLFCFPNWCLCWWTNQILYTRLVMRGLSRSLVILLTSQCIHLLLLNPKWAVGEKGQSQWVNFSCLTLKWLPFLRACQVC